jgi:hypothetical protein
MTSTLDLDAMFQRVSHAANTVAMQQVAMF